MRKAVFATVVLVLAAQGAFATGFMVPTDKRLDCLKLESHRVAVEIAQQSAVTEVVEVFRNQHGRELEADFVFVLPEGASVGDFKMYVNGKLVTGEVKEAGEARGIYEEIVRKMRDPGLLEYLDSKLLRLRVYPVPAKGTQEVRVRYSETLKADGGLVEYVYPLKTPQRAAETMKDFTLAVDIHASAGIKNVYSPTHDISVQRTDENHVKAGFEKEKAQLDRDFQLFYALSDKDFGASLISYKPSGKDGYFLLLLSPKAEVSPDEVAPKEVTFVIDVSGSMNGDKIAQAKRALKYCVGSLNKADRFNIITFSTGLETFAKELVEADEKGVTEALGFVGRIKAGGGTNIHLALDEALSAGGEDKRPSYIVFLTDGLPTVGETNADRIVEAVKDKNKRRARVFSFGVGYDVNARFLDRLAQATSGANQYVAPGEDIKVKVSAFFEKVGEPLMSGVAVDYGSAGVYDVYPTKFGDLFAGSQIVVAGRYRGAGRATIVVRGRGARGEAVFEYPVEFDEGGGDGKDFAANIWAGRKIAYLLGEIRINGETSELKDEVVRLSKEYGIITPYTSYLITEGSPVVTAMPVPIRASFREMQKKEGAIRIDGDVDASGMGRVSGQERKRLESLGSLGYVGSGSQSSAVLTTGKAAVTASESQNVLVVTNQVDRGRLLRQAAKRNFANIAGVWVDENVTDELEVVKVKFGSAAYFELYKNAGTMQSALALGDRVVLQVGKYCVQVEEDGAEDVNDAKVQSVIRAFKAM